MSGNFKLKCVNPAVHPAHTWDPMSSYPEEVPNWVDCPGVTPDTVMHIGRSWDTHPLEDECPCPQELCGLVARDRVVSSCTQHPPRACKTIRQSHYAIDCPVRKTS